jgi:predicted ester cyclase
LEPNFRLIAARYRACIRSGKASAAPDETRATLWNYPCLESAMSKASDNKSIVRSMIDSIRERGFVSQTEFFADNCLNQGIPVTRKDIRCFLEDVAGTFFDAKLEPVQILAEGDWVVLRCRFTGTHAGIGRLPDVHEGMLARVPPTGRTTIVQHIHMFRFAGGKIVEHWSSRDDIRMLRQLGLIAPPDDI